MLRVPRRKEFPEHEFEDPSQYGTKEKQIRKA
jgi:hypothetical protein